LFLFSGHFGYISTVIPPLPIALDAGTSNFREGDVFVKEKAHYGRMRQKKAWND
jgi:hypothetical protein